MGSLVPRPFPFFLFPAHRCPPPPHATAAAARRCPRPARPLPSVCAALARVQDKGARKAGGKAAWGRVSGKNLMASLKGSASPGGTTPDPPEDPAAAHKPGVDWQTGDVD